VRGEPAGTPVRACSDGLRRVHGPGGARRPVPRPDEQAPGSSLVDQDETPTEVLPGSAAGQHQPTEPLALARYAERMAVDGPQHPAESAWWPDHRVGQAEPPTQTIIGLPARARGPVRSAPGQRAGASLASPRGGRPRWLLVAGIAIGLVVVAVCGLTVVKLTAAKPTSVVLIHPARSAATATTVTHGAGPGSAAPGQAPAVTAPAQAAGQQPAAQMAPPPSPAASAQPSPSASSAPAGSTSPAASPPAQPPSPGATGAASP
jgi:hypothetical protein